MVAVAKRIVLFGLVALCLCLSLNVAYVEGQAVDGSFTVTDAIPPAAVTDLAVSGRAIDSLTLTWTAPGDDGNWGVAAQYDIRYSSLPITTEAEWDAATPVTGEPAPKPAGSTETFVVDGLSRATVYCFALKTADGVPNWSDLSNSTCSITLGGGGGGGGWGGGSSPPGPPPDGGGPPVPEHLRLQVNVWDTVATGSMTEEGVLIESIEAASSDGVLSLLIHEGTTVLDYEGSPPRLIELEPVAPPDTPPDTCIIGQAFNIQPGCTFDPPLEVTVGFTPEALSDGVGEQDLVIAYYDQHGQEWVMLPCEVDTEAHKVTALIGHSTTYAILGRVSPPPATTPTGGLSPGTWAGIGIGLLALVGLSLWLIMRRRGGDVGEGSP